MLADFGVETIGKIKGQRTFRKVNNIAFWGIDEDFVSKEVEAKFFDVDFFAGAKFGGGFLEFGNPEKVGWEMLDFASFVILGQFLFVVIETCGETTFGIFVHFVSANLEFDNFFIFGDDGSM